MNRAALAIGVFVVLLPGARGRRGWQAGSLPHARRLAGSLPHTRWQAGGLLHARRLAGSLSYAGCALGADQETEAVPAPTNGSFESAEPRLRLKEKRRVFAGWDFGRTPYVWLPTDWRLLCGGPASVRLMQGRPGGDVHSGRRALYLKTAGKSGVRILGGPLLPQGGLHELTCWCKGSGRAQLAVYAHDKPPVGRAKYLGPVVVLTIKATPQWRSHRARFAASWPRRGGTHFRPGIILTGEVWIDDVVLRNVADTGERE